MPLHYGLLAIVFIETLSDFNVDYSILYFLTVSVDPTFGINCKSLVRYFVD